ncbi:MAG: spondin domain-containing protein, partial [Bryobacteraceae bacterium]
VSASFERLAEDGNTGPVMSDFAASGAGTVQGALMGNTMGNIAPGETTSQVFNVDGSLSTSRYFSFATMVIPSNDAFVGNDDPTMYQVFDSSGNFVGASFTIAGSQVLDAGSEVNTELPMDTAFFGQTVPNTGPDENGVVHIHPGYKPKGSGGILDDPMFANANFKASGYEIAQITVSEVPEPSALLLFAMGACVLLLVVFRRRRSFQQK